LDYTFCVFLIKYHAIDIWTWFRVCVVRRVSPTKDGTQFLSSGAMCIDLKELETELVRTRRKLSDWSATRTQFAIERSEQHVTFLSDQNGRTGALSCAFTHVRFPRG
jgi:hypothetical protein